jgi:rSAM/selenodomain-associated transferase 1
MHSTTIVFTKAPRMGKVKTRIGLTHGAERAFTIYNELLKITGCAVAGTNHHVAFTGTPDPGPLKSFFPNAESFFHQSGTNLGDRLKNAFLRLFDRGYDRICAIGCDCPTLSENDMSQSFTLLEKNDVVIGPAVDGGYYLIACKSNGLAVFNATAWGTPGLFDETIALCKMSGFQYALLEKRSDIDTFEDHERWKTT